MHSRIVLRLPSGSMALRLSGTDLAGGGGAEVVAGGIGLVFLWVAGALLAAILGQRKAITEPRFREDVFGFGRVGFDFFAQLVDDHAERFSFLAIVGAPDRL